MDDLLVLLRRIRFTTVRLVESYDMGEVDELLDGMIDAITEGRDPWRVLDGAGLQRIRLREGYDIHEVDRFLDRLHRSAREAG